jgi:hypothetical protein
MPPFHVRDVRLSQVDHLADCRLRQTTPFPFGSKIKGRRQGRQSNIEQTELNRFNRYRHGRRLAWLGNVQPVGQVFGNKGFQGRRYRQALAGDLVAGYARPPLPVLIFRRAAGQAFACEIADVAPPPLNMDGGPIIEPRHHVIVAGFNPAKHMTMKAPTDGPLPDNHCNPRLAAPL